MFVWASVARAQETEAKPSVVPADQNPELTVDTQEPADNLSNPEETDSDGPADPETMFPHFKDTRFWLSGQANFIFQTHPPFPAPYSGPHSLGPQYEKATSRVLTLYTGVRLSDSFEVLADLEEAGGAALSQGFGLAGNTDLDIVRNPSLSPLSGAGYVP
jgi:high affinity Mn2+ porin